ncbi:5'-methylthioadenosine/S-adenosylhomocysteine nucleosidase-like [Dioscorea cayenensis subsp. rotundata]|uniref:5'-methylthioadenosine/S-adenosylhomocysteine nucleosidase-like n=1 Tax=Dioscorea cayennensis subsp. rotundata TaxID=55577 RepID=A0AB40BUV8_DIOCR|nr:5'-methylthioadenosine/S-adenosylhomocysteine nucleosidase-like [Dioscorea cayenensis subsp. rotundata]
MKAKGACVGDIYLASDVAFHDGRILIHVFDTYGVGARRTCFTPNLIKELNLKVGKLSNGNSLEMTPQDETAILANDAIVKDMEENSWIQIKRVEDEEDTQSFSLRVIKPKNIL